MARILAISSYVASGHVGLAAIVPALNRLGHEVVALPTVVLSNHLGYPRWSGETISPKRLHEMLDALDANGSLADVSAVLTGYLPTTAHVRFAAAAAARVSERRPAAEICVDPVLGDDPDGLYIEETAAVAVRDELVPLADVIFPNRFELAFISGLAVDDPASAAEAAEQTRIRTVLATSIPSDSGRLANVLVTAGEGFVCEVPQQANVPHGTGDFLAALFLGHRLKGGRSPAHLGAAVAGVAAAIAVSDGRSELALVDSQAFWTNPAGLPVQPV